MRSHAVVCAFVVSALTTVQGEAQSASRAIRLLEDRLNNKAIGTISGQVDFEFAYVRAGYAQDVVLLEEIPTVENPLPASAPADESLATEEIAAREDTASQWASEDTVAGGAPDSAAVVAQSARRDSIEAYRRNMPRREIARRTVGSSGTQPPPVGVPDDLAQADVAALKGRLSPPVAGDGQSLLLAVRPPRQDARYAGESVSLADEELDPMGRRFLRWDTKRLYSRWPTGSVLFLEAESEGMDGEEGEVSLHWSFRRPGPPPLANAVVVCEGNLPVVLKKRDGQWKVSHVEGLIAALGEGLAATSD